MSDIELDYDFLTQQALRRVIFDCLSVTAELGTAPGEHHFYIEFLTGAPGVIIPDHLKADYPERMTIVLQHQFHNLVVKNDEFSVSLSFKGKPSDLTIPYEAIASFFDPSVEFGLRFETVENDKAPKADTKAPTKDEIEPPTKLETGDKEESKDKDDQETNKESADVVSLDSFRKK